MTHLSLKAKIRTKSTYCNACKKKNRSKPGIDEDIEKKIANIKAGKTSQSLKDRLKNMPVSFVDKHMPATKLRGLKKVY